MRLVCTLLAFSLLAMPGTAKIAAQADSQSIVIGSIDYFGYGGLDLKKLDGRLPLRTGQSITQTSFKQTQATVREAIIANLGGPPTDINATCCDANNHLTIYLGLPGSTSRSLSNKAAPAGTEHLDPQALKLYDSFGHALESAVAHGVTREDWTKGYVLSYDPTTHAIQLQAREYALHHETQLARTLRNAADPQQRITAAWLLGYASRSSAQIQVLAEASTDSDKEVRNNAVRALSVLSAAKDAPPLTFNVEPLIAMLYSGLWTDRNKASLLFQMMTESRNPALLDQLRKQAMPALIEGARWTDLGHAQAFLVVLGRIGKLPDADIERLMHTGREKLIEAANH